MTDDNLSGHLVLLMAPSGSGKSALLKNAKTELPELHFAISCTTRAMRPGEKEGEVYHFLDMDKFNSRIKTGDFLEWAEYGGNLYGTLKSEITEPMRTGQVVIREVELQGIQSIVKLIPKAKRTIIYIDAGDWESLKQRILSRAPISEEQLALRHERYLKETAAKPLADIVIKNEDGQFDVAKDEFVAKLRSIIANVSKKASNDT